MTGMNAATGRVIDGLAHIRQSIANILTTPIGSRVMRRDYGSEVPDLIDQPLNGATQLRIYAATAHAVMLWEPRISLTGVQLERGQAGEATLILQGVALANNVQLDVSVGNMAGSAA
jgi:phage baseplate assembly protein W